MLQEARSAAGCVAQQLAADEDRYTALGWALRGAPPAVSLTVARGSSDHAAAYAGYLIMARLGRVVASLPMSLLTLYGAPLQVQGTLALAVSQSGQSPDVVEPLRYFRQGGGTTVAMVNDVQSPLAQAAEWTLPLHAGAERSVAATKSFTASLVAGARLVAHWQDDHTLQTHLNALPEALHRAAQCNWQPALDVLAQARGAMVVGRGVSFPIALEAALKLKETSGLQAEAFSGAEIQHGPMALVEPGYPLLILATRGPASQGLVTLAEAMRQRGARVLLAAPDDVPSRDLTLPTAPTPELDPICAVQALYGLAA
jgi:glutamine---fructose-6-phosphate transaminase (isomerizing)